MHLETAMGQCVEYCTVELDNFSVCISVMYSFTISEEEQCTTKQFTLLALQSLLYWNNDGRGTDTSCVTTDRQKLSDPSYFRSPSWS